MAYNSNFMKFLTYALLILLTVQSPANILTLELENDIFFDSDKFYTHGTKICYYFTYLQTFDKYFEFLFKKDRAHNIGLTIGQNMYTPSDISISTPITDDRPYAGWLYGGIIFKSIGSNDTSFIEIDVGTTGPDSYAEEVQKQVHEWTGSTTPMGWSNQIKNVVGINVIFKEKWKLWDAYYKDLGVQFNPFVNASLGNICTYFGGGVELRTGYKLPPDLFIVSPIEPTVIEINPKEWFFFLFASIGGKYVARNILLDAELCPIPYYLEKEDWIGEFKYGAATGLKYIRIELANIIRTKEFTIQNQDYIEYTSLAASIVF